jgi:hypothetical protein
LRLIRGTSSRSLKAGKGPVSAVAFAPDGSEIVAAEADNVLRFYQLQPSRPTITSVASDSTGGLWIVGRGFYTAYNPAGSQFSRGAAPSDLKSQGDPIAVTAIGTENPVVLTDKNTLVSLRLVQQEQQLTGQQQQLQRQLPQQQQFEQKEPQQQQPDQKAPQQQQPLEQQPAAPSVRAPAVAGLPRESLAQAAGQRHLHAVVFKDMNVGWVAGDDGLILHTKDGGQNWSKLSEEPGLSLLDLHIEPSGVAWAVGKHADGRQAVVAADAAEGTNRWRELPNYLAPWFFLLGIPALLLAGSINLLVWRPDAELLEESIEEVATSDEPLRWNDPDARLLKPLSRSLSRFLLNVNTKPPLTLAITGRWGSGKSSLMRLLMTDLRRYGGQAVWFNAWHHREEEHLLAALFESIRREAPPEWWSLPGLAFRVRLFWVRSKRPLLNFVYIALFFGIAIIILRLALSSFRVEDISSIVQSGIKFAADEGAETWKAAITQVLTGSSAVAGLALLGLWLRGKLVALPANPAKLVAALARRASLGDFSDKLAFRHRFGEQFKQVCQALWTPTSPGLVLLIDDLDRCQPEDVLKVLEAVNYLVSAGPCTVVLGMDRRQVEYCVGLGFEKLVEGLPEDELLYAGEETADKAGKQRAFARHYLEKLINIEVPVPALDDRATDALLLRGIQHDQVHEDDGPAWLQATKRIYAATYQIARVGLLAFLVGMILPGVLDRFREPAPIAEGPSASSGVQPGGIMKGKPELGSVSTPQQDQPQDINFELAKVEVQVPQPTRSMPDARRWLWWGPTILLTVLALLFGAAAIARRERRIVKDSPAFASALRCVKPLLNAVNATPRALKRYQNRMRYLAARLRPATHEPDEIDSVLFWIGRWIGRPLVPKTWFEEGPPQVIREPALILLGAIELFAPKAFAKPAELLTSGV